jgi:transposase
MNQKLPREAFQYYVGLSDQRSYDAVADHFGVHKRTVTRTAKREDWQGRLDAIEKDAREKSDAKLGEALGDVRERHLKTLKVMNMRAVEALRSYPLTNGMEAMRAAEMVIKLERLIHGEPTDRNAVSVEDLIKREYAEWMDGGGAEPAE